MRRNTHFKGYRTSYRLNIVLHSTLMESFGEFRPLDTENHHRADLQLPGREVSSHPLLYFPIHILVYDSCNGDSNTTVLQVCEYGLSPPGHSLLNPPPLVLHIQYHYIYRRKSCSCTIPDRYRTPPYLFCGSVQPILSQYRRWRSTHSGSNAISCKER